MPSDRPAPSARVGRLVSAIERERVVEYRRLTLTSIRRADPTDPIDADILRYLVYGKRHWHPAEQATPLTLAEMEWLDAADLAVWASPVAAYPEQRDDWSVLNRLVDTCFVGDRAAVDARRVALEVGAEAARRRQTALTDTLVARLAEDPPPGLVALALRGQYGDITRPPDDDIDLLALFDDAAEYPGLRDRLARWVDGLPIGRISWLVTDFTGRVDHAEIVRREPADTTRSADTHGSRGTASHRPPRAALDLYVTATRAELVRVLRGDPAESAANLQVLDAARPLWGADAYRAFVDRYRSVLDLRARARIGAFAANAPRCHAPVIPADLARAHARGVEALGDALPRVEMWSDRESPTAMLSPFVAALVIEALVDDPSPAAAAARRRMVDYLHASGSHGVWAFAPHADTPWPPDLDDTACAIAALLACGHPPPTDPAALIADRLGPADLVETWIIPTEALAGRINDVDPVVTANALWCLDRLVAADSHRHRDLGSLTRRLTAGLAAAVDAGPLTSAYYHRPAMQAFFIARWAATAECRHAGSIRAALAEQMRALDPRALPAVELAALVGALARCGAAEATRDAVPRLIAMQRPDGHWPGGAAFIDPGGGSYGSAEFSTALATDALAAAQALLTKHPTTPRELP